MCDLNECKRTSIYFVLVATEPQVLGDGTQEKEGATRSLCCCKRHLTVAITSLHSIEYRKCEVIEVRVIN